MALVHLLLYQGHILLLFHDREFVAAPAFYVHLNTHWNQKVHRKGPEPGNFLLGPV